MYEFKTTQAKRRVSKIHFGVPLFLFYFGARCLLFEFILKQTDATALRSGVLTACSYKRLLSLLLSDATACAVESHARR